jgi:hypothetical protein
MLRVNMALTSRHPPPGSIDAGGLDGGIITRKSRKGVVNRHAKTKVNCNKYLAFHAISRFLTLDAKW